jgi:hypothetical protein
MIVPTHLTVRCFCKKYVNIRTKEREKTVVCWNCSRSIWVWLGDGKNNVRVKIEGIPVKPTQITQ